MNYSIPESQFIENYQTAREHGGWVNIHAGLLKIDGEDKDAFIQRQTTNDIGRLTSEKPLVSVLTSPSARILDVMTIFNRDTSNFLITLPGYQHETEAFLRSRIFFMDKVDITNVSDLFHQIDVFGLTAIKILKSLGTNPGQINSTQDFQFQNEQIIQITIPELVSFGCRLVIPVNKAEEFFRYLESNGCKNIDSRIAELLRVESGRPGPGSELTQDYTPLEVNLQELISNNKGCYTGQEIIARQLTYDKVSKNLIGLQLSGETPIGTRLFVENQVVGTITSYAHSPVFEHIGLAVVKRPYNQPDQVLYLENNLGTVETIMLPFTSHNT